MSECINPGSIDKWVLWIVNNDISLYYFIFFGVFLFVIGFFIRNPEILKFFFLSKAERHKINEEYLKKISIELQPLLDEYEASVSQIKKLSQNNQITEKHIREFNKKFRKTFALLNDVYDSVSQKKIDVSTNQLIILRMIMKNKYSVNDNFIKDQYDVYNILMNQIGINTNLEFNWKNYNGIFKSYLMFEVKLYRRFFHFCSFGKFKI